MRRISGNYFDKGNVVDFNFQVASSWQELRDDQTAAILQVLNYKRADRFTILASLIALLSDENWRHVSKLPNEELHGLIPLTDFIFNEKPPVKNLYPKLNIRKKTCYPPAEDLSNIGFGEWCFLYEIWSVYQLEQDKTLLNKLMAILYRPADLAQKPDNASYTGDVRERFNENLIDMRARNFRDTGEKEKAAIFSWFCCAMIQAMDARSHLFPKQENNTYESSAGDTESSWFTAFRELLGPKWGTTEQLKYTNAMFVLDAMDDAIRIGKSSDTPKD